MRPPPSTLLTACQVEFPAGFSIEKVQLPADGMIHEPFMVRCSCGWGAGRSGGAEAGTGCYPRLAAGGLHGRPQQPQLRAPHSLLADSPCAHQPSARAQAGNGCYSIVMKDNKFNSYHLYE